MPVQSHVSAFAPASAQVPPFWHGFGEQSFTSLQVVPLPAHPELQVHEYEPALFVHAAFASHGLLRHSFTSAHVTPSPEYPAEQRHTAFRDVVQVVVPTSRPVPAHWSHDAHAALLVAAENVPLNPPVHATQAPPDGGGGLGGGLGGGG